MFILKIFELKNNTSISSIINLRNKFLENNTDNTPLNPKEDTKDKKVTLFHLMVRK